MKGNILSAPNIVVFLDTETTGLSNKVDRIAEVAALKYDLESQSIIEAYHQYINPEIPMPDQAAAVHGLTDEFLKDKPTFKEIAPALLEFSRGQHIVIHNARYDVGMLDAETIRNDFDKFSSFPAEIIDSLRISRRYVRSKRHTLDRLCDLFKIDKSARTLHGALLDCELLAKVYPHLLAAKQKQEDKFAELLSFRLGAALPATIDEAATKALELKVLIKILTKEQNRYLELIKDTLDGKNTVEEFWRADFSERTTTAWTKIMAENMPADFDLKPYQKSSIAMSLKHADSTDLGYALDTDDEDD